MKLNFTRKTWYFFLLASAAVSMLNGFFVLAGQTFGLLEQIAFCLAALRRCSWRRKRVPPPRTSGIISLSFCCSCSAI